MDLTELKFLDKISLVSKGDFFYVQFRTIKKNTKSQ